MGSDSNVAEPSAELVLGIRNSFFSSHQEVSPRRQLSQEVGDQVREIIERLVGNTAPDSDLAAVRDRLADVVSCLDRFDHGRSYEGYSEASMAASAGIGDPPVGHSDYSPVIGLANPLAPPLRMDLDPDTGDVIGRVSFGSAYEGAPGTVHGGWVSAALDELMGAAQALTGNPGMTGTLTVIYRSPTPIREPLTFRAWVDRVEGRKIFAECELLAGDRLCAEGKGVFITVDFAKMAELLRARNEAD